MYKMNIPYQKDFKTYEEYVLAVDKFFYRKFGFKEWICMTPDERVNVIENLYPVPVIKCLYEEDDNRCITYRKYEKGGLK